MYYIYTTFIYNPLYNGLILLADVLPFFDAGVLIILFTVIVKLILFPLSKKAVRTQAMMKLIEPDLKALKERYKSDRQAQALETMKLYKAKGVNPFSSILLLLIQLPIIFALYRIFYSTGFTNINADLLYSFVSIPPAIDNFFLGLIDMSDKSVVLAVCAAVSQYFQIKLSTPVMPKKDPAAAPSLQDDFARTMHVQMRYVLPIVILFVSYHAAAALALYWTTSNLFMIGQELYIRKKLMKEATAKA